MNVISLGTTLRGRLQRGSLPWIIKCLILTFANVFNSYDSSGTQNININIPTKQDIIELQVKMNVQVQEIMIRRCMTYDTITKILLLYVSSDVAASWPQIDDPQDETY